MAGLPTGLPQDWLDAVTIPELRRRMDDGTLTAVGLTRAYLDRGRALDERLVAVVARNPRALDEAAASDKRRAAGAARGPLDGIPVVLKDSLDTVDLPTTGGSRALLDGRPAVDAVVVQRLRAAGAVILGKTNMSEFGTFRSRRPTSGWSGAYGQTTNPYALNRSPCGSSSGSCVAVAASLAQVAIGTETAGSVICPAGANGVVGYKPSIGLVPRTGTLPVSAEQDTVGVMARHVVDIARTLPVLQGFDASDPVMSAYPRETAPSYELDANSLRGRRVGIWRLLRVDYEADRVVAAAERVLRSLGATTVDVDLPMQEEIGDNNFPALVAEFRRDLEKYLAQRDTGPNTIAELIEFNRRDPVELSRFGQELLEDAVDAPSCDDPEYLHQRAAAVTLARHSIDDTLLAHRLDLIMAPTNSPAWKIDYRRGDRFVLTTATPPAVAGYPNVTVPAGFAGPLPVGVSFFAGPWSDAAVLSAAFAFERACGARRPPGYRPVVRRGWLGRGGAPYHYTRRLWDMLAAGFRPTC